MATIIGVCFNRVFKAICLTPTQSLMYAYSSTLIIGILHFGLPMNLDYSNSRFMGGPWLFKLSNIRTFLPGRGWIMPLAQVHLHSMSGLHVYGNTREKGFFLSVQRWFNFRLYLWTQNRMLVFQTSDPRGGGNGHILSWLGGNWLARKMWEWQLHAACGIIQLWVAQLIFMWHPTMG